jgi:hypothetical protein
MEMPASEDHLDSFASDQIRDQGQFLRKDVIGSMGGYPDLMLMEDVEFSMRLKEMGSPCFERIHAN